MNRLTKSITFSRIEHLWLINLLSFLKMLDQVSSACPVGAMVDCNTLTDPSTVTDSALTSYMSGIATSAGTISASNKGIQKLIPQMFKVSV